MSRRDGYTLEAPACAVRSAEPAAPSLWVPARLALGTVAALGFARFAYSLLLPAMRSDLHWTFAQAGALGTAMAASYLLGSLSIVWVERKVGTGRAFGLPQCRSAMEVAASRPASHSRLPPPARFRCTVRGDGKRFCTQEGP